MVSAHFINFLVYELRANDFSLTHVSTVNVVYDEPDDTYLVLECMGGGDLIDRIIEKRHYTEFDAKEVSRKLILGVEYCHKKKIANRNLKPENLLLVSHIMLPVEYLDVCIFELIPLFLSL